MAAVFDDLKAVGDRGLEVFGEAVVADRHLDLGNLDHRFQLALAEQRHRRHRHAAGLDHREPARDEPWIVRPAKEHAVAGNQPHVLDQDVRHLRALTQIKLNLEMAATDEMVKIACAVKPEMAMLVPEGRMEVTTEGGLDVAGQEKRLKDVVAKL